MAEHSIGFLLNRTARRMSAALAARFEPYDITPEQFGVLRRLAEEDGITQKELAERTAKDQTNMTRLLDQLERKGLIERRQKADDRRCYLIYGSAKGHRLGETLAPIEEEAMGEMLAGLSEMQIAELRRTLDVIASNAGQPAEGGDR